MWQIGMRTNPSLVCANWFAIHYVFGEFLQLWLALPVAYSMDRRKGTSSRNMSPASKSKSKSKEKTSTRAAKEKNKTSSKLPGTGNSNHPSAPHPDSGTSYGLDRNGHDQNIDETDEHSVSSHGTLAEYDSLSNNGRYFGESEDHKEKVPSTASRQESIPGSDNDKREKIRLQNEKKHQRQKERRAQELHERCSGYLMSRKLEALSQQLVAMGFSSERATMALMLNDGKVQESVNWLFEGSEEDAHNKDIAITSSFKIDISEELARIAAMVLTYKCTKQEVERAVVACEGDLDKAEGMMKAQQRPEPPVALPKPEEITNSKHPMIRQENHPTVAVSTSRNDREINNSKGAATVPILPDSGITTRQSVNTNQLKSLAENRWLPTGSSSSGSFSMAPPTQVNHTSEKLLSQLRIGGNEERYIQQGAVREPVTMMQRPQSVNVIPNPGISSISNPLGTAGSYGNNVMGVESTNLNSKLLQNQTLGPESSQHLYPQAQSTRILGSDNFTLPQQQQHQQYYAQNQYAQQILKSSRVDQSAMLLGSSQATKTASSPSLAVPSSLGLFSGWGSTGALGSSAQVNWNAGEMMSNCDYNSIDWSLNSNISSSKANDMMLGLSSMRFASTNGIPVHGIPIAGTSRGTTSSGGARDWTSPFAGKDIFSVPRQFVTSPSPPNQGGGMDKWQ